MSAFAWQYKPKNKTHKEEHVLSKRKPSAMPSPAIQTKLTVGQPNDIYEQEADRLADRVMRMTEGSLVSPGTGSWVNGHSSSVQRKAGCSGGCPEEERLQRQSLEDEEEMLQAKSVSPQTPQVTSGIESGINSMKGGGQVLTESTRSFFESRFGADFSQVRVHTGDRASQTAQAINAKAYTTGNNIVFNSGQYKPHTTPGKYLLAHELTHTIQQNGTAAPLATKIQRFETEDCNDEDIITYLLVPNSFATAMVTVAITMLQANPISKRTRGLLKRFFMSETPNIEEILRVYRLILGVLAANDFTYHCDYDCPSGRLGSVFWWFWTWPEIHFCLNLMKKSSFRTESIPLVMIHELAHYSARLDDEEYCHGGNSCPGDLSESDALDNADSYAYFAYRLVNSGN